MTSKISLGQERFKSDSRQLAGFLLLVSTCALIFPLPDIASLIGPNGTTASEGIPLSALIASILVVCMGMMGIVVGYLQAIHDYGNKIFTGFFLVFIQLAWIAYITNLTALGKGARSGMAFIPPEYGASATDVKFVGAMGMMGIFGHGSGTLGALAFAGFALYAFQAGKPGDRPSTYYAGRLTYYAFALFFVGFAQFLLGCYILANIGSGPLPYGPIIVAMFVVNFPEISIFCGLVNVLAAFYGGAKSLGFLPSETDHSYSWAMLFGWFCNMVLAVTVQVAYIPADGGAAAAPTIAMLTSAMYAINALLDSKMRTTPKVIPADYYGLAPAGGDTQKEAVEVSDGSPEEQA